MRRTGRGEISSGEVSWHGDEQLATGRVGFLLRKCAKQALIGYNLLSPRVIVAGSEVYAPTAEGSDAEVTGLYRKVEKAITTIPKKDVKFVIRDWNAKIGDSSTSLESMMSRYGYGERNEHGRGS